MPGDYVFFGRLKRLAHQRKITLMVIQNASPDLFFSAQQQERLQSLMEIWREARDKGRSLPPEQQAELDTLVEAELRTATARTAAAAK